MKMREKLVCLKKIEDLEFIKEKIINLRTWTFLTHFKKIQKILTHFRNFEN